jgi:hypothetical protein
MEGFEVEGAGFVSDASARAAVADEQPVGPIDFAVPYVRRKPWLSFDIEFWAIVFSGGSLYLVEKGVKEAVTNAGVAIDDSIDDMIDVARGRMTKRAFKRAIAGGLQDILALAHEKHVLTREELSAITMRRGLFRFRIMFPPLGERKKFSLVVWNKYRKEFKQRLEALVAV